MENQKGGRQKKNTAKLWAKCKRKTYKFCNSTCVFFQMRYKFSWPNFPYPNFTMHSSTQDETLIVTQCDGRDSLKGGKKSSKIIKKIKNNKKIWKYLPPNTSVFFYSKKYIPSTCALSITHNNSEFSESKDLIFPSSHPTITETDDWTMQLGLPESLTDFQNIYKVKQPRNKDKWIDFKREKTMKIKMKKKMKIKMKKKDSQFVSQWNNRWDPKFLWFHQHNM